MWVGIYNIGDAPITADLIFEASPTKRWTRRVTIPAHAREGIPVQDIVLVKSGTAENFGTQVVFAPGQIGVVSFALWHDSNYGRDRVVDLSPTFLCKAPQ